MADEPQVRMRPPSVLEDPSAQAVARTYAEAFLNAAGSAGVENALEELASFLDDALGRHPQFADILLSGIVNRDEKVGLIDRAVVPHASPVLGSFLRVLARKDRLELLPLILDDARVQHERRSGRCRVQLASARPLSESALERIQDRLRRSLPFEPVLDTRTDPALLGGLVIQVEDTVYDSSLRTRLRQLRGRLRERSLHEIQSGRDRFSHPEGD